MKTKCIAVAACMLLSGCFTQQAPVVEPTKKWENHYMTAEQFYEGTKDMQLAEGESIWVMSNKTLARLLKNVGAKNVSQESKEQSR